MGLQNFIKEPSEFYKRAFGLCYRGAFRILQKGLQNFIKELSEFYKRAFRLFYWRPSEFLRRPSEFYNRAFGILYMQTEPTENIAQKEVLSVTLVVRLNHGSNIEILAKMFCCSCGTAVLSEANYCQECGSRIISQSGEDLENNLPNIIEDYFNRGYQYTAILGLLEKYHGVKIHIRTLKRKLREYGLRRRGSNYSEETVRELITREMQDAGRLGGYRYIWHALRLRHRINIPRRVVATIMKEIDPEGVRERRARRLTRRNFVSFGSNFTWHIDGKYCILLFLTLFL